MTSYQVGAGIVIGMMSGLVLLVVTTNGSKTTIESVEANSKPVVTTVEKHKTIENNEYMQTIIFKECKGVMWECQQKAIECIKKNGSVESCDKVVTSVTVKVKDLPVETEPEKPNYSPPKYNGAFQLIGVQRKCGSDGVLLESNDKLYFIKNCNCTDGYRNGMHGWVEPIGTEIMVDIGRNGRRAIVVKVSNKETANDDRKDFSNMVREYELEYRADMKAYSKAMVEYRKAFFKKINLFGI